MSVNLKSLIGKLNDPTRNALEAAAGLCVSRTNYDIEVEHYFLKLLDQTDGDLARIVRHFGIDPSRLAAEADAQPRQTEARQRPHSGSSAPLSSRCSRRRGPSAPSISAPARFAPGFTILALAVNEDLARLMREISPKEFQKIQVDALRKDFLAIVSGSQRGRPHRHRRGSRRCRSRRPAQGRRQDAQPRPVHGRSHRNAQGGQARSRARPRRSRSGR